MNQHILLMTSGLLLMLFIIVLAYVTALVLFSWWDQFALAPLLRIPLLPWQWPHVLPVFHHFIACVAISVASYLAMILGMILSRDRFKSQPLGQAHFASLFEIMRGGFLKRSPESIIIGKKYGKPLYANGFEHVLVFAPSGSGKTTSISIPNLFHFPYSCVVNDVKLTLFHTTSKYREQVLKNRCYCWVLSNSEGKTHRYNPLSAIPADPLLRMTEIQRMAHILIPDGKGDPIWYQSSRKLFKTLVLYVLDDPDIPATFGAIARLVKQPDFDVWLSDRLEHTTQYDPEYYRNGFSYLNNHPKTRSSILETFSGYLELFDDPFIDAATSASDFDITLLRQHKMTIYIGFSNDDMQRLSPLLTLFWEQVIGAMVRQVPDLTLEPYPVLCLIDEFSSLGKIERLRRALTLLREYRVRCVLMLQYIAQTYERYSPAEAQAFTQIKTKLAYTPDGIEDAEFISKRLGTKTIKLRAGSTSSHHQGESQTSSFNYQAVPLMRPDDIMRLPKHHSLIIRAGMSPIQAQQLIWYRDNTLRRCNLGVVGVPQHTVTQTPFIHRSSPIDDEEK